MYSSKTAKPEKTHEHSQNLGVSISCSFKFWQTAWNSYLSWFFCSIRTHLWHNSMCPLLHYRAWSSAPVINQESDLNWKLFHLHHQEALPNYFLYQKTEKYLFQHSGSIALLWHYTLKWSAKLESAKFTKRAWTP